MDSIQLGTVYWQSTTSQTLSKKLMGDLVPYFYLL